MNRSNLISAASRTTLTKTEGEGTDELVSRPPTRQLGDARPFLAGFSRAPLGPSDGETIHTGSKEPTDDEGGRGLSAQTRLTEARGEGTDEFRSTHPDARGNKAPFLALFSVPAPGPVAGESVMTRSPETTDDT